MKICLVTGEFPPMHGGVGDYSRCLATALSQQGCDVSVLTSARAKPAEVIPGVEVFPLVSRWDRSCWRTVTRALQQIGPQVVNIQYQAGAFQGSGVVNLFSVWSRLHQKHRWVITFHDLNPPYLFPKAGLFRKSVLPVTARMLDAAITTNPEDNVALRQPSYLIPIGSNIGPPLVTESDRERQRDRWGVGASGLLLAYFGFLTPSKGVETLAQSLRILRLTYPDSVLLMVGGMASDSVASDLSYASQLRRKIEASDINQNVRWTGFAPSSEVSACLSAADICVLPFRDGASFRNGTLVAAIAHHLVLVTTAQPRNPAVESIAKRSGLMLQDGVNARLAPPQEPMLLAQAISELARQPEQRRQLRQGMQELSRLTTWETIATQTIRVYREVLGNA